MTRWPCALYMEKGHLFKGFGFGAKLADGGEAVFNTGMSGYQEIFTDPSYRKQIVVMGYPHIGNTGINKEDIESRGLFLSGLVVRDYCETPSNWRSVTTLDEYLEAAKIPAITDVDTREITTLLRKEGAQRGVIFPIESNDKDLTQTAQALLSKVAPMEGQELVSEVSCKEAYEYQDPSPSVPDSGTFVVYDFGVKTNILRYLKSNRFKVWVVPHDTPSQEVMKLNPTAVMLSNGPGDPASVKGTVSEVQALIGKVPLFAICMGHQLLARALGASTYKLKFGHHGINHPVQDTRTGKILITSQNHGFAVPEADLKQKDITLSHVNLNDKTVEGFYSEKLKLLGIQFHPEAAPGPSDASYLFQNFIKGFLR